MGDRENFFHLPARSFKGIYLLLFFLFYSVTPLPGDKIERLYKKELTDSQGPGDLGLGIKERYQRSAAQTENKLCEQHHKQRLLKAEAAANPTQNPKKQQEEDDV